MQAWFVTICHPTRPQIIEGAPSTIYDTTGFRSLIYTRIVLIYSYVLHSYHTVSVKMASGTRDSSGQDVESVPMDTIEPKTDPAPQKEEPALFKPKISLQQVRLYAGACVYL